jgi:hypothetical protein
MINIMIPKTYYDSYGKSMIADRVRLNPSWGLSMACLHAPRGSQSLLQRDKQARGCACCAETILLQRSVQQAALHCFLSLSLSLSAHKHRTRGPAGSAHCRQRLRASGRTLHHRLQRTRAPAHWSPARACASMIASSRRDDREHTPPRQYARTRCCCERAQTPPGAGTPPPVAGTPSTSQASDRDPWPPGPALVRPHKSQRESCCPPPPRPATLSHYARGGPRVAVKLTKGGHCPGLATWQGRGAP